MAQNSSSPYRALAVTLDGRGIGAGCRIRLQGRERLSMLPDFFRVRISNLSDVSLERLRQGGKLAVACGDSVLASGAVLDVYRQTSTDGTETEVVFSGNAEFWNAMVSVSVAGGLTASAIIRQILAASNTGVTLLSVPNPDAAFDHPMAFCGRAADGIETILNSIGDRGFLTESGLNLVSATQKLTDLQLTEKDLTDGSSYSMTHVVIPTRMTGWTLGRRLSLQSGKQHLSGLIIERAIDADNYDGPWRCELIVEV